MGKMIAQKFCFGYADEVGFAHEVGYAIQGTFASGTAFMNATGGNLLQSISCA